MACAHAKFSGDVGVCLATSGPGRDPSAQRPLRRQARPPAGGGDRRPAEDALARRELPAGGRPGARCSRTSRASSCRSRWRPAQVTHLIDRAVQIARATRSVTCVIVPADLQEEAYEAPPRAHGVGVLRRAGAAAAGDPGARPTWSARPRSSTRAKVAMLVGAGAREAAAEVEQLAELLGAGVAKALNGRDVLPDDLPYVTGSIGLLGTKPSDVMMQGCDTLLMVGSSFPYSEWLPEPGQARGVQIDLDATPARHPLPDGGQPRRRRARHAARAAPAAAAQDRPLLARRDRGEIDRWWGVLADQAEIAANPLNPMKVFHELSPRLPDGCIVTADSGSGTNWYARHLRFRRGMRGALSRHAGDDGPGAPVRARGQVRASRPPGDRHRGRRRDADERDQRADRRRQAPRPLDRPAVHRARAQQPRPQPGHVGAARAGRRPQARGLPGHPGLPVRALRRAARLHGASASTRPSRSRRRGRRRWRQTSRSSSRRSPTPRCRRCRRTSSSSRPRTSRRRSRRRDPARGQIIRQP